jgi:hypothetical protein
MAENAPAVESNTSKCIYSKGIFGRWTAWRKSWGLPKPGPFEQLHRDVRGKFEVHGVLKSNHV